MQSLSQQYPAYPPGIGSVEYPPADLVRPAELTAGEVGAKPRMTIARR